MLRLGNMSVENIAQWKKASVNLSTPGINFLRGRNDDRGGNPNGSGKSSLVNASYIALMGDHQLAVKKRSLKSITSKSTRISIEGMREKIPFTVELHDNVPNLSMDGVRGDSRRKVDARSAILNDVVRMPPELWSSMVHVNGVAGHPLVRGTSAQRCQFLEKAFELDRWAQKYKSISDLMSGMRRAASELEDAKHELRGMGEPIDASKLKRNLETHRADRKVLREKSDAVRAILAKLDGAPERPEESVEYYAKACARLERDLKNAEADSSAYDAWRDANARSVEVDAMRTRLKKRLKDAASDVGDKTLEQLEDLVAAAKERAKIVRNAHENSPAIESWKTLASKIAARHNIEYESLEDLRALSRSWVRALKGGDSRCPVCGSRFKKAIDARDIESLSNMLERLPKDLRVERVDLTLEEAEARVASRVKRLSVARECESLRDQIARLPDVKVLQKVEYDPQETINLARKLSRMSDAKSAAQRWEGIPKDADASKLEKSLETYQSKIDNLDVQIQNATDALARAEALQEARSAVEKRIARLEEEVALHPIYRGLQAAYSPTGMRLWMLSEMLEAIIGSLNAVGESTRDRVVYGYKLSRNRDLTLTASNVSGTFDVRFLSGGEAGMFVMNLIIAVLPLLPDHRRCSTLILDEVDANASRETRAIIASEYLPRLSKVVPSVWIVTPTQKSDFMMQGANEWLVVKRGEVSRLTTPERLRA